MEHDKLRMDHDKLRDAALYGDAWADVYDDLFPATAAPDVCVSLLAELAGDGPALELAIGTGRIALPLQARGVKVHGIDASEAMVAELRAKPGGETIPVSIGDMAEVDVEGTYPLIYLVANTIFCLLSQEAQSACFMNAARRLSPGGVFLIEAFVPDLTRFDRSGQRLALDDIGVNGVTLEAARHDLAGQRIHIREIFFGEQGTQMRPIEMRYAWPSELDLMARLAGLRLRVRWRDWNREPFTSASGKHVSIYAKP